MQERPEQAAQADGQVALEDLQGGDSTASNGISFQKGHVFLLATDPGIPSGPATEDRGKEGIQYFSIFHVLDNWVPFLLQQRPHIFSGLSFVSTVLTEVPFVVFDIPCQI